MILGVFCGISSAVADVENALIEVENTLMSESVGRDNSPLMQKNVSANTKSVPAAISVLQVLVILSTFDAK